ncbi:MAG: hypothetical protein V4665_04420 [Patescibacteria group bacterium]
MKISISKLDAAKRQLEMALNLFFRNADPVSIHTLVGAAHQVLQDICEEQGTQSIKQKLLDMVKPEKKTEFIKKLNAPRNFFKHAENDPNSVIEFNPEMTDLILWDTCLMYTTLTQENPAIIQVFNAWNYANSPEILILPDQVREKLDLAITGLKLNPQNRIGFLELVPLIENNLYGQTT